MAKDTKAAAPAAAEPVARKFAGKLHPSRFKLAESLRNIWFITTEAATPLEVLTDDPAFLSHVAKSLRQGDRIEVMPDDGAWFAELIVRSVSTTHARLALLRKHELAPLEDGVSGDFAVRFQGLHHKHAVVRLADAKIIQSGFDTKEDAMAWLAANLKGLAA